MVLTSISEISRPDKTFNLHIKDDHNYIVEGAVVSNCHRVKANKLKNLLSKSTDVQIRYGFTGSLSAEPTDNLTVTGSLTNRKF